jgi:hypothetical protein
MMYLMRVSDLVGFCFQVQGLGFQVYFCFIPLNILRVLSLDRENCSSKLEVLLSIRLLKVSVRSLVPVSVPGNASKQGQLPLLPSLIVTPPSSVDKYLSSVLDLARP